MAPSHQSERQGQEKADTGIANRPVPFLVGLWRQLGPDFAPKQPSKEGAQLFAALQSQIIPRLVVANRLPESCATLSIPGLAPKHDAFTTRDRQTFVAALLSDDASLAGILADSHLANGHPAEEILMEMFAWSARELGELWEDDQVSFVDVTIGLCRLHEALHRFSGPLETPSDSTAPRGPSILIASAPQEQHVFGVLMAAELFRNRGWSVTSDTSGDPVGICQILSARRFDMVGLSVSHDGAMVQMPELLRNLRKASKNPSIKVIMGGRFFDQAPQIALDIGADGIAGAGLEAPEYARNMLAK